MLLFTLSIKHLSKYVFVFVLCGNEYVLIKFAMYILLNLGSIFQVNCITLLQNIVFAYHTCKFRRSASNDY